MAGSQIPGPRTGEPLDAGTSALTTHRPPGPTGVARTARTAGASPGRAPRTVVLSFDDGPEPVEALDKIMDTLRAHRIKAEFYVLGVEVAKSPAATASIAKNGHAVQNHSWDHPRLDKLPQAEVVKQLVDTQEAIAAATGQVATKVRPPYGAGGWPRQIDAELGKAAKTLALAIHNWDVDTEDWKAPRGVGLTKLPAIRQQLDRSPKASHIDILMHVQPETANDLPALIDNLKQWGYAFDVAR